MSRPLDPWDLLETLMDAVIAVEGERIVYVNPASERLFGAAQAELLGTLLSTLIPSCPMLPAGPPIQVRVQRRDGSGIDARLVAGARRAGVAVATLHPTEHEGSSREGGLDRLAPTLLRADVAEAFAQPGPVELVATRVTDAIVRYLGATIARIWLLEDDEDTLRLIANSGRYAQADETLGQPRFGARRARQAACERRVFITNDVPRDPIHEDPTWATHTGITAFAAYPLLIGPRVIGVCAAFAERPLDGDVLEALASIAVVIAQGVERLRTEESILAWQAELAVILGNISEGVIGRDHFERVVYANEAASRIFGYASKEALYGVELDSLLARVELRDEAGEPVPPEQMPGRVTAAERRQAELLVGMRASPTSELRWLVTRAVPTHGPRTRTVTIYHDVTEHKRVERGLRFLADASVALASAVDRSAILTTAAEFAVPEFAELCAIYVLDEAKGVLDAAAIAHVDPDVKARGQDLWRRYPPDPSADWGIGLALRTGRPSLHPTMDAVYRAASLHNPEYGEALRAFRLHSSMIVPLLVKQRVFGACIFGSIDSPHVFDEQDLGVAAEFGHRVSLAIEVSLLLDEAREGVRTRDAFLSVASHELKTPITTLSLQAQGLERLTQTADLVPAVEVRERAVKIRRQARRLTALVDRLLDVSRISYGRLVLHLDEVCLADLVREVASRFDSGEADTPPILLHAEPPVIGQWDRIRLDEVVTNLLSNAIKYGRGRPVELYVSTEGDRARLDVVDHGIGIAKADQAELFQRFQRFVSDRSYGGFGLGLWISQQIIEALGGKIRVESELGVGSTFTIELPLGGPPAPTASA